MFYAQALRTHTLPLDLNAATEDLELEKAYYESFDPENTDFVGKRLKIGRLVNS